MVPRTTRVYARDVMMSIDDLMAFATSAQFVIRANRCSPSTPRCTQRTGRRSARSGWRSAGSRQVDGARTRSASTEYYINRAFASVGQILQRHDAFIFPLIEDMFGRTVVEVRQEITAVAMRRDDWAPGWTWRPVRPRFEVRRIHDLRRWIARVTINTRPRTGTGTR